MRALDADVFAEVRPISKRVTPAWDGVLRTITYAIVRERDCNGYRYAYRAEVVLRVVKRPYAWGLANVLCNPIVGEITASVVATRTHRLIGVGVGELIAVEEPRPKIMKWMNGVVKICTDGKRCTVV